MSVQSSAVTKRKTKELGFWQKVWRQRQLVVLSLPVLMVIIFSYVPLWGWSFAFFNYKPTTGLNVFANDWIGLQSFQELFTDAYFWRGLKNSLGIGVLKIVFSYVFSLLLAVMINEVKVTWFKRTVQTVSYLPHFVSWVVAANLVFVTLSPDSGIVNEILLKLGIVLTCSEQISCVQILGYQPNLTIAVVDKWVCHSLNVYSYLLVGIVYHVLIAVDTSNLLTSSSQLVVYIRMQTWMTF